MHMNEHSSFTCICTTGLSNWLCRYSCNSSLSRQISPWTLRKYVSRVMPLWDTCKYTGTMWFLVRSTKYGLSFRSLVCGFQPEGYRSLLTGSGTTDGGKRRSTYFHSSASRVTLYFRFISPRSCKGVES